MTAATLERLEQSTTEQRERLTELNQERDALIVEEATALETAILDGGTPSRPHLERIAKQIERVTNERDALERELQAREAILAQQRNREATARAAAAAGNANKTLTQAETRLVAKLDELLAEWDVYLAVAEKLDDDADAAAGLNGRSVYTDVQVWFREHLKYHPEKTPRHPFIRRLDAIRTGSGVTFSDS